MPPCFWGKALPATGKRPVGVEEGRPGTPKSPDGFGARGGLFTDPPLDSDRRHVIGAVLDVCREQSEGYV